MAKILPFVPRGKTVVEGNLDKHMQENPGFKRWAEAFAKGYYEPEKDLYAYGFSPPPPPHNCGN